MKKHRYNPDDFIPPSVLGKILNWEYALDEEDEDGQDESTIKPAAIQDALVPHHTCLTVCDATFKDGSTALVLMDFGYVWDGQARSVQHFRVLDVALKKFLWIDPHPNGVLRTPEFFARHGDNFPIEITSRLNAQDGEPLRYRLRNDPQGAPAKTAAAVRKAGKKRAAKKSPVKKTGHKASRGKKGSGRKKR